MDAKIITLKEFPAHSDRVTTVAIGKQTADILVTGGSDKKVNLWSLDKPNCTTSFLGHTTPISYVQISPSEDEVCAGSQSGNIKTWDLGSLKTSRTLMGHRATIKCIEFHYSGNWLISGSSDSVIKFWDERRKSAILSYKGHNSAINAIKFSPNGRWFASGGEDGSVKIWEIRKGQILHEYATSMPITAMAFHPNNLFLASASSDQTIQFFDLKLFSPSNTINTDGVNRCLLSSPVYSNYMYGTTNDVVNIYEWNANTTRLCIPTSKPKIQDVALAANDIFCVSTRRSNVSVVSIDIRQFTPIHGKDSNDPLSSGDSFIITDGGLEKQSYNVQVTLRLPSTDEIPIEVEKPLDCISDSMPSESTEEIFHPQKNLPRTPRTYRVMKSDRPEPSTTAFSSNEDTSIEEKLDPEEHIKSSVPLTMVDLGNTIKHLPNTKKQQEEINLQIENAKTNEINDRLTTKDILIASSTENVCHSCKIECKPCLNNLQKPNYPGLTHSTTQEKINVGSIIIPSPSNFLLEENPEHNSITQRALPTIEETLCIFVHQDIVGLYSSDYDLVANLKRNHHPVLNALQSRQKNILQLYDSWRSKDIKATSEMAVKLNDLTVLADFLGILSVSRPSKWTLDICAILLPAIVKLIQSRHETHIFAGLSGLRSMLRNFASIIRTNVASPIETLGVDLTQEARYNKSVLCRDHLLVIQQYLLDRPNLRGVVAQSGKEVLGLLSWLETKNKNSNNSS